MDVVGFVEDWTATMTEKLCLQWNDFKENVHSAFGRLRDDKEFTDVTLACEDGQQVEAHKVILAASSFQKLLRGNKHPLIFKKKVEDCRSFVRCEPSLSWASKCFPRDSFIPCYC